MFDELTKEELALIKKLKTPAKIQDYLNDLDINFEEEGDSCMSPRQVIRNKKAHCMEGAMLAALALKFHGYPPLLLDLEATKEDFDHVVAVFQIKGKWGAIGKTNHAVLRYREPVYRDIRELVMSFFHEYFLSTNGKKTLRRYSDPIDLSIFDNRKWAVSEEPVWYIPDYLARVKHYEILDNGQAWKLRKADSIEIKAGKLVVQKGK